MKNILKVGDKIMFIEEELSYLLVVGSQGERRCWANGDDKLIVGFIKNEKGFRQFVRFLAQGFGIFFQKTKCSNGVLAYEVVGMSG